jgi:ABC-type Mn2+/Zn2+ transport system permease subunit
MSSIVDIYATDVMRRALLEAVLVGALCGFVGAHVVLRRLPFFTVTVAHATFPGVVIAAIVGFSELTGGLLFAFAVVALIYLSGADRRLDQSVLVGVALAGSFGIGAMLQSTQDGFTKDLAAILVGSILTVQDADIAVTVAVAAVVVLTLCGLHKELVLQAFDPATSEALGYRRALDLVLLLVVAATVVTAVPIVGTMLSVALLAVPAMSARLVTRRVGTMMGAGAAYGAASGALGLTASAEWDISAGASIALASAALFALTWLVTTVQACWLHPVTTTPTPTP